MYEKAHGCAFTYVSSWTDKKVYRFKEFSKQEQEKWAKALDITRNKKDKCKEGTVVTFFFDSDKNDFHVCGPGKSLKENSNNKECKDS